MCSSVPHSTNIHSIRRNITATNDFAALIDNTSTCKDVDFINDFAVHVSRILHLRFGSQPQPRAPNFVFASFAKAIPQPLARSSPSTTSPLTSITRASAKTSPPPTVSSRILVPAKMMFPTTASLSSSTGSPPSSTTLQPSPTALRFASRAPYINHSTPNPYQEEPTIPLPCSIPLLHSFDKANPRPLACLSSKRRRTRHPLLYVPFHPPSRAQK